jgi:hypothetical protein
MNNLDTIYSKYLNTLLGKGTATYREAMAAAEQAAKKAGRLI